MHHCFSLIQIYDIHFIFYHFNLKINTIPLIQSNRNNYIFFYFVLPLLSQLKMAPLLKLIDNSLRLCVLPLSAATIWLTATNHQHNSTFGDLSYTHLLGLQYMICISAISAAYALFAAVSTWITCLANRVWLFFISDQIMAYLMVTSGAAVMELVYLVYNGDKEITWSEVCSTYGKFCYRIKIALILHALAVCCFLVLAVISAYRAFSLFQPPVSSKQVEHEHLTT
ncbi:CASP-like protein 2D1 [Euphorbia lathyris]|uniref:CASP-like protein 2D1 n=1 Tax=Euphorbia lathyris TaxID=212925 RepID=UPI003313DBD5